MPTILGQLPPALWHRKVEYRIDSDSLTNWQRAAQHRFAGDAADTSGTGAGGTTAWALRARLWGNC